MIFFSSISLVSRTISIVLSKKNIVQQGEKAKQMIFSIGKKAEKRTFLCLP